MPAPDATGLASATPLAPGPSALGLAPSAEHIWRFIGNHDARLDALDSGMTDARGEVKELRSEVAAVQAHLAAQDADVADIKSGIAALTAGQSKRADEHQATLHAIKLTAYSTVLSALIGIAVFGVEHILVR